MHTIHTSRPTKKQRRHRPRPNYPELPAGERRLLARPECGTNKGRPTLDGAGKPQVFVSRGKFVFQRDLPVLGSSKYDPVACDAKKGVRQ